MVVALLCPCQEEVHCKSFGSIYEPKSFWCDKQDDVLGGTWVGYHDWKLYCEIFWKSSYQATFECHSKQSQEQHSCFHIPSDTVEVRMPQDMSQQGGKHFLPSRNDSNCEVLDDPFLYSQQPSYLICVYPQSKLLIYCTILNIPVMAAMFGVVVPCSSW